MHQAVIVQSLLCPGAKTSSLFNFGFESERLWLSWEWQRDLELRAFPGRGLEAEEDGSSVRQQSEQELREVLGRSRVSASLDSC